MSSTSSPDTTSTDSVNELRTHLPFIRGFVWDKCSDQSQRDDLIQEALVAAWRAILSDRDNGSGAYVRTAVRRAVLGCNRGDGWTGEALGKGKPKDPLRNIQRVELDVNKHDKAVRDAYAALRLDLSEVLTAVGGLPQREQEIVLRRFWGGYTSAESARAVGLAPKTAENLWTNNTKPFLAERLAHLRSRVA